MQKEITQPTMPVLIEDLGMIYLKETSKCKLHYAIYRCSCGNEFKSQTHHIKTGNTKSCGCYHRQKSIESNTTHGLSYHRIFNNWKSMIDRTTNINHKSFKDYAGNGIKVCQRWLKVENFIDDMYPSYQEGLTIDRINVNRDYEYSNCRWATRNTQARNTRQIRVNNKSGYRGVSFHKATNKWMANISISNKKKYLGVFNTSLEAAKSYDKYVIENNLEHTINGVY